MGKEVGDTSVNDRMKTLTFETLDGTGHHLVEDVVRTLERLLGDDTGLLQQICWDEVLNYQLITITIKVKEVSWNSRDYYYLQVSMSAPASLPDGPK